MCLDPLCQILRSGDPILYREKRLYIVGEKACENRRLKGDLATQYSQYKVLAVQSTRSTKYSQYNVLAVQSTLSTKYSQYKVLAVQSTRSTKYSQCKVLAVQSTRSTKYSQYKVLVVPTVVRNLGCLDWLEKELDALQFMSVRQRHRLVANIQRTGYYATI